VVFGAVGEEGRKVRGCRNLGTTGQGDGVAPGDVPFPVQGVRWSERERGGGHHVDIDGGVVLLQGAHVVDVGVLGALEVDHQRRRQLLEGHLRTIQRLSGCEENAHIKCWLPRPFASTDYEDVSR